MILLRLGTFETNSSSCHCLVISSPEDFKAWINGDKIIAISNEVEYGQYKDFEFIDTDKFLSQAVHIIEDSFKSGDGYNFSKAYVDRNRVVHEVFDENGNWSGNINDTLEILKSEDCLSNKLGYVHIIYDDYYKRMIKKHGKYWEIEINTWAY
jgi:hypothetical protein